MIHENKEIPTTNTSKEEEDDEDEGEDIENNFTKADLVSSSSPSSLRFSSYIAIGSEWIY